MDSDGIYIYFVERPKDLRGKRAGAGDGFKVDEVLDAAGAFRSGRYSVC